MAEGNRIASLVTTYNRPEQLAKTLPQIAALGAPVLVVDDGSDPEARSLVYDECFEASVEYIELYENRGLACALNIGLSYWLADPEIEFISVFQDDCDIDPDLHAVMLDLWHSGCNAREGKHAMLTGFDAPEHAKGESQMRNGIVYYRKDTGGGVHLFAHRDLWDALMPIPSLGLGLPNPGMGSRVDFNVTSHSRVGPVPLLCVPGLVSHRAWKGEDSTWGSTRVLGEDAPLSREAIKGWVPA